MLRLPRSLNVHAMVAPFWSGHQVVGERIVEDSFERERPRRRGRLGALTAAAMKIASNGIHSFFMARIIIIGSCSSPSSPTFAMRSGGCARARGSRWWRSRRSRSASASTPRSSPSSMPCCSSRCRSRRRSAWSTSSRAIRPAPSSYSTSSYPDYLDLSAQNDVFDGLVGYSADVRRAQPRRPLAPRDGRDRHRQLLPGLRRRRRASAARFCRPTMRRARRKW